MDEYSDATDNLEASLTAKEKIISDLHSELLNLESTLSYERDQLQTELGKLNDIISEKVQPFSLYFGISVCFGMQPRRIFIF